MEDPRNATESHNNPRYNTSLKPCRSYRLKCYQGDLSDFSGFTTGKILHKFLK